MNSKDVGGYWKLWENIARSRPGLGRPDVFDGRIDQSAWMSFTSAFKNVAFYKRLQQFTGTALTTFKDSNCLMSLSEQRRQFRQEKMRSNFSRIFGLRTSSRRFWNRASVCRA